MEEVDEAGDEEEVGDAGRAVMRADGGLVGGGFCGGHGREDGGHVLRL